MSKSKQTVLDAFGRTLVAEVRDEACESLQRIISGKMRDKSSKALHREYLSLDERARAVLRHFLLVATDAAVIQFLYFVETNPCIVLNYKGPDGVIHDMNKLSDGLVGEVHNEDGWFARFSRFTDSIEPVE